MAIRKSSKGTKTYMKDTSAKFKKNRKEMLAARKAFLEQEVPEIRPKHLEEPKAVDLDQLEKDLKPIIQKIKKMPGRKK